MSNYKYYTDGPDGKMRYRQVKRTEPLYIEPDDEFGWPECIGLGIFLGGCFWLIVWILFSI